MRMFAKKVLTLAIIAGLMASTFTGCEKKNTATAENYCTGFVPQKDMKITVWNTQGTDYTPPAQPKENVVEDWLVAQSRVKVKNIYGNDGGQWDAKLARMVAGDNLPELLFCGAGQGPAHFSKLAQLNKVKELTPELLQKYAPNVWNAIPQKYWEKIKVDGKIYGIPSLFKASEVNMDISKEDLEYGANCFYNNTSTVTGGSSPIVVRDDILKMIYPNAMSYEDIQKLIKEKQQPIGEMLMDVPIYKTEDYINFLYKIKNLNLKEDGYKVYSFGYNGGDNWTALSVFGGELLGYNTHYYTSTWNTDEKRITIPLVGEVVKKAALYQNRMIRDEVIDPESLAHTTNLFKEKVMNGRYAIVPYTFVNSSLDDLNKQLEQSGKKFRYRVLYTHIPAIKGYEAKKSPESWGNSVCILNSVSDKDLPQILNWIDIQFTDKFNEIVNWGPKEAGLYTQDENGKRTFADNAFQERFVNRNTSILPDADTKGIGKYNAGLFGVSLTNMVNRWNPVIMNRTFVYTMDSGINFPTTSKYVKDVLIVPPCDAWSSEFSEIPEVVTYWAKRGQWEDPFKVAFTAMSDNEFEQKWQSAVDNLYNIVNVDAMAEKMTEAVKPILDSLK